MFSFVYNFGVYIWIFWCYGETQSVNLIKLPHHHSNCDRSDLLLKRAAPCTEKVSRFGTTKPGVKETRETQLT